MIYILAKKSFRTKFLKDFSYCPLSLTTLYVLLNWRTRNSAITAKYTTVALQRFQSSFTIFTFVKELTSICWHYFFFFVSTSWASYY